MLLAKENGLRHKTLILADQGPPVWTSTNYSLYPLTFLDASSPDIVTLGLGLQPKPFGGHNSDHNRIPQFTGQLG